MAPSGSSPTTSTGASTPMLGMRTRTGSGRLGRARDQPGVSLPLGAVEASVADRERFDELLRSRRGAGALAEEADAAFPPERLAAQRARIARRLAALARQQERRTSRRAVGAGSQAAAPRSQPARVLPFPVRETVVRRPARPVRWVAAAAAAGLLVGLVAGRGFDRRLASGPSSVGSAPSAALRAAPAAEPRPQGARGAPALADLLAGEPLLVEIEAALASPRVAELQAIDALTPRVREP